MKTGKLFFLICISFFPCIFFSGCDTLEKDRRVILVLLDYSASSSDEVLNKYIRIINQDIFSHVGRYDCVIVMPIDEGSKKEPVKLIYEDMLDKKFIGKSDGFTHADDSVNNRVQKYINEITPQVSKKLLDERITRKIYTNYTDIVGALQLTNNIFDKKTDLNKSTKIWDFIIGKPHYKIQNVLVLLSDMIQDSPECSFDNKIGISDRKSNLYLSGLKNQKRIPNLKDCTVFVIGSTGRNSSQIDRIQSFWTNYFQSTNADMKSYGYDVDDKLTKYLTGRDN